MCDAELLVASYLVPQCTSCFQRHHLALLRSQVVYDMFKAAPSVCQPIALVSTRGYIKIAVAEVDAIECALTCCDGRSHIGINTLHGVASCKRVRTYVLQAGG